MNKVRKLIRGIGINDADYVTQKNITVNENGQQKTIYWKCPFYNVWRGVIERCYSDDFKLKHPTYKDCTVCDEWLTFSNFRKWMETQDWEGNTIDKDILFFGNKHYSPETCVFVPHDINCILKTQRGNSGGVLPIGVTEKKDRLVGRSKRYQGLLRVNKKQRSLGYFHSPIEAHSVWQLEKANEIMERVRTYSKDKSFRQDVAKALLERRNKLIEDNLCKIETIVL